MSFGFDLDLLKTFAAVVDSGGFTKAAERVHLTQSTVSQQIKKLETSFGHTLLLRDKSSGHIQTTEEGELLLSYARRLLATAEEAMDLMRKPAAPKTVRLGVPEDFLAKNPEVVKNFTRAALKGWKDALANPEEAAKIEIQYVKALDPQIVVEEIAILKRIAITPDVEKNGFGYISPERMKNTVDFINKNIEVSGDKLTAEQIYRPGYLPETPIKP